VVVLDARGIGALPDAGEYGDASTNTLAHLARCSGGLEWLAGAEAAELPGAPFL
jgi:phosphopentomutase